MDNPKQKSNVSRMGQASLLIALMSLGLIFVCVLGISFLNDQQPEELAVVMETLGLIFGPYIFIIWLIISIVGVILGMKSSRSSFQRRKVVFATLVNGIVAFVILSLIVLAVIAWNYGL